jgi:hypothetical protein
LTLLEELKYDLAYMTQRNLVNFDNDATSCYDRIVVPFASLINRKYGMHRDVVTLHATTLQQARFRLKTATGISELTYQHSNEFPIHGTGQGSGNSPCIWLFISSTLFDIHLKRSQGMKYVSPDGKDTVHMSMVGFVDDSTGSCNDFTPNSQIPVDTLLQRMETDAQVWNNLLYCSGGKLELPKCSFHVLSFEFAPDGSPKPTINRYDDKIHILDSETSTPIPIHSKRSFDPHKTLGHQKSPKTSAKVNLKETVQKANNLAFLIALSPISREGAYLAYNTVFIPTVKYTLPQSFFPKKLLEHSQAKSLSQIVAKCGYNRRTARALLFAPRRYAGAGFIPWHLLQGEGQIQHIVKHLRTNSLVSKTLKIAIQWAQWRSGHDMPIFEDTATPLPHLES